MRWLYRQMANLRLAALWTLDKSYRENWKQPVRTGLAQVNRLRVQTQGDLFTASINDIKVATLSGEPPKSPRLIGVYGESAELSENAWDFTKLRVAVAPEPAHSPASLANP
jgi:hypothetical protein